MKKTAPFAFILIILIWIQFFGPDQSTARDFFAPENVDFSPLPPTYNSGQWYEVTQIRTEVNRFVKDKNFTQLEQMVNQARSEKLRFKTVTWVLHDLYNAIPYALYDFNEIHEFIAAWRTHSPVSNIPDIIEARAHFAHAWEIRGNGYADSISEDAQVSFKSHLSKSWESALLAEKKGPPDAELCSLQTELAFAFKANKQLAKQYFNQCLKIEPGYYHLYFKVNRYLQPIWFGSRAEHIQFVEQAADANTDLYGDGLYALLVSATSFYTGKIFVGYGGSFSWGRTQSGFKDLLSQYGASSYIYHIYGYCAMLAHDHQTLAEVLKVIGTQWDDDKQIHFKKQPWYNYHLNKAKAYLD